MFDLRAEAEMRLYSEKLAKELALKRQCAQGGGHTADLRETPSAGEQLATPEDADSGRGTSDSPPRP
ncbi:hypothetical protein GCM10018793_41660 [Streptomyces sulfonofaciens]|uniref:Uncharacterized protein n=1 Tax=Streptomyces sulfonofaciens TaxID=68272 RepID=A0A919GD41_9ACTN|nr:hypothetical protein [Streptomyces sulfonofaciens]GHH82264.1 hypothetical protein GCM10018793_41660 [Streptomyces sulfonofaciens]